jgi:hypothetical protein
MGRTYRREPSWGPKNKTGRNNKFKKRSDWHDEYNKEKHQKDNLGVHQINENDRNGPR